MRSIEGNYLLCQNCQRSFIANEIIFTPVSGANLAEDNKLWKLLPEKEDVATRDNQH